MSESETLPGLVQIGETLRAARENRALSLDQAAARLRCDVRVVEALEAGRFADVGPAVFARGHLLRYAEMLGEPGEAMVAEWAALADGASAGELMADSHPRRVRDLRVVRRRLVGGTALLCVAIVAAWGFQQMAARPSLATAKPVVAAATDAAGEGEARTSAPPAAPVGATAIEPPTDAATSGQGGATPSVPTAPSTPAASVAPGSASAPAPRPVPAATAAAVASSAVPAGATASPAERSVTASPGDALARTATVATAQLAITATADSWLEIYDRRNRRLYFGVARPGTLVDVRGALPLRVVVGNVPATTFELDGRRVEVPRDAMRTRRAATFRVGPDGRLTAWPRA